MQNISPAEARAKLENGSAVLFDVRSATEYAQSRIPGATLCPADSLNPSLSRYAGDKEAIFYCGSGRRTELNRDSIVACGFDKTFVIDGGLGAWSKAGLPIDGTHGGLDLQRQVQIVVGLLVLATVLLAYLVSTYFLIATAFIGAGLFTAGLTGFCGMAILISRMPWNRHRSDRPGMATA